MNIIIIGAGESGEYIAGILSKIGNDVTIIDKNPDVLDEVEERIDVQTLCGIATDISTLEKAEIKKCNIFITLTNNDEVNMLACQIAKKINSTIKTIARIKKQEYFSLYKNFYKQLCKIDLMISPQVLSSLELLRFTGENSSTLFNNLAEGKITLKKIKIPDNYKHSNIPIKNLDKILNKVLICAILRDNNLIIPGGEDIIKDNDTVYVIGENKIMQLIEKRMGLLKSSFFFKAMKNICIAGAGKTGFLFAQMLEKEDFNIKIIEADNNRCEFLADNLDRSLIIHGNATDPNLINEQIIDYDFFISSSGKDDTNIMSAMLAKYLKVEHILIVIHSLLYKGLLLKLGFKNFVCPKLLVAETIINYIKNDFILTHKIISKENTVLLDLVVEKESEFINTPLYNLKFPDNTLLCFIIRKDKVFVPRGSDTINMNDNIILITSIENLEHIKNIFKK